MQTLAAAHDPIRMTLIGGAHDRCHMAQSRGVRETLEPTAGPGRVADITVNRHASIWKVDVAPADMRDHDKERTDIR